MDNISIARAYLYAHKIQIGEKTLDAVPPTYKTAVRLILEGNKNVRN